MKNSTIDMIFNCIALVGGLGFVYCMTTALFECVAIMEVLN